MTLSLTLDLLPASSGVPLCNMLVGKALLNSPRTKQLTEGQLALDSFLARRRQRYQARRKRDNGSRSCEETISDYRGSLGLRKEKDNLFNMHERNCVIRLASIHVPSLKDGSSNPSNPPGLSKATKLDDFSKLDCEELADHVVSQAKVRRTRRRKAANVLQKIYKPVLNSSDCRIPKFRTSTPVNSKGSTPISLSPAKSIGEARDKLDGFLEICNRRQGLKAARKVLYWSEKQSAVVTDSGIPCVSPSSPKPASNHEDIKFVPSIKSPRKLKSRLQVITMKNQEDADKEVLMKVEKENRQAVTRLKAQQRVEIYALNKVMAEFERLKFERVMSGKV